MINRLKTLTNKVKTALTHCEAEYSLKNGLLSRESEQISHKIYHSGGEEDFCNRIVGIPPLLPLIKVVIDWP